MLEIIGALVGIGMRMGLIGKGTNVTKLALIGTIVSIAVISFFVSMVSGTATLIANATIVSTFMLYMLAGLVITEIGMLVANTVKKVF